MRFVDRQQGFPASSPDEISIFTWNLLAPSYDDDGGLDWETVRLPAFRRWFEKAAACDVICVQELDKALFAEELHNMLAVHGFEGVVQDRNTFPVVNATYFKTSRFQTTWVEHRSRVLLCGLQLADGRELCVANAHLEAGPGAKNEAQRLSQLSSALKRMRTHAAWCEVVCGDFNSSMGEGSELREMLSEAGLARAPANGPTYAVPGYVDTLDHIWAGPALKPRAVLRSSAGEIRSIVTSGLPTPEHPSDHLPVAAVYNVEACRAPRFSVLEVEVPMEVEEALREEWLAILHGAPLAAARADKRATRAQKQLETSFLGTLHKDHAQRLRSWQAAATEAAKAVVKAIVLGAMPSIRAMGVAQKVIDPGGGCAMRWAGG
mmetsp:Transcript_2546/g.6112  ORF Transcript_2546/g.6112 Transcript_2546/m.6112 type:complete len:377 (-) Transcript_2546:71-1201(-)